MLIWEITRQVLLEELRVASSIADRASPALPVLQNVLLQNDPAGLRIVASDMEMLYEVKLASVATSDAGGIAVPAKTLYNAVRAIGDDTVAIRVDGLQCEVLAGRSECRLGGLPPSDFPAPQLGERREAIGTLPPEFLAAAANYLLPILPRHEYNVALECVQIGQTDDTLWAIATDRYRLGRITMPRGEHGGAADWSAMIHKNQIRALRAWTTMAKVPFQVSRAGAWLWLECETPDRVARVALRMPDAEMPDLRPIIDTPYTAGVVVARADLASALRQCEAISKSPVEDYVTIRPEPGEKRVVLHCKTRDSHAVTTALAAEPAGEWPGMVRLNLSFLLTFANILRGETVAIWWSNRPDVPARLEASQGPVAYWVMPMWDPEASRPASGATEEAADEPADEP
jgi:DNA polymerase-3 subunit beta